MNHFVLLFVLLVVSLPVSAQDTEIEQLESDYLADLTTVRGELAGKYLAALQRLHDSLVADEKPEEATFVEAEIQRVQQELTQKVDLQKADNSHSDYPPVVLKSADAVLKGKVLLSEANIIFKWSKRGATVEWDLPEDVPAGEYEVILSRSCASGEGGSYVIAAGDAELEGSVVGAGEWTDWDKVYAGNISLSRDARTLSIEAKTVTSRSLMNIREVIVAPKGTWDKSNSEVTALSSNTESDVSKRSAGLRRVDNVTLEKDLEVDGDSFHVVHEDTTYHLRLLYVDAPEENGNLDDPSTLEWVKSEADYFGITPKAAMDVGTLAAAFVRKTLSDREFSVLVARRTSTSGGGEIRKLAMVVVDGEYLSKLLVENGLVRINGIKVSIPDGPNAKEYAEILRQAEAKALDAGKGGWGF